MTTGNVRTLTLAAALLLGATAGAVQAQEGLEARVNPHAMVSSDGQALPKIEKLSGAARLDSFEGFGPQNLLLTRFEDTGAAADRAEPVTNRAEDFLEALNLPGIGRGSLESIIGSDNRVQVTATTTFPYRAIVLITFSAGRCTGWLVGPDLVVTAGHCVHSGGSSGDWYSDYRVYPGRKGSSSPYGSCTAKRLYSVQGWTVSNNEQYDYGAVKLNCTIGNTVGWFGAWWQSASLTGLPITVSGYPGDKPLTHWRSTGNVAVTQTRQIFYKNDTAAGQSGAPVFQNRAAGSSFWVG
jgi:V8-like Glu-specific endopeptidase